MSAVMPREVLKWLQILQLSTSFRNPRRDFANGLLIAEIVDRYMPGELTMSAIDGGSALARKLDNWDQLNKVFSKIDVPISKEVIDGTLHCKVGAAEVLVQMLYMYFSQKTTTVLERNTATIEFTDAQYQESLPLHARTTLSTAIKSNIRPTEFRTDKDTLSNNSRIDRISQDHQERRMEERANDPLRFGMKPRNAKGLPTNPKPAEVAPGLHSTIATHTGALHALVETPRECIKQGQAARVSSHNDEALFDVKVLPPTVV
jgi:hypothetical protein